MKLLITQKNQIFDWIVESGLSPAQFSLKESEDSKWVYLKYRTSDYYFNFYYILANEVILIDEMKYSPAKNTFSNESRARQPWSALKTNLIAWITYLRREIEQPDKWGLLYESSKEIGWNPEQGNNSQFSFEEVQQIQTSVKLLKLKITEIDLTDDQLHLLNSKLDYLVEKAQIFGRVDWKNLFVGTIISCIVQVAIPPEVAKTIWAIVGEIFKNIILLSSH